MANEVSDSISVSFGDSLLRSSDIATLEQRGWLNDAVISFYFELLASAIREARAEARCQLYMPWAVGMMTELAGSADARNALPPVDADMLLLPINDAFAHRPSDIPNAGSHWSTVIVKRESGGFSGMKIDSLGTANDAAAESVIRAFETIQGDNIRLIDEVQGAQINGWDCGIYVLIVASRLVEAVLASESRPVDYAAITPSAVADFRGSLHHWLSRWAVTLIGAQSYHSLAQVEAQIGSMPR